MRPDRKFWPDRNRTGFESFWPEPDRITSQKMLTRFDRICRIDRIGRIFTGFLNFNTQLTSHKHKYGSFNFEIWVDGKARTCPDIFMMVLGPCAQYCPCEASEQKLGQKPKSTPKEIKPWTCHHSICLEKTSN